MNRWLRLLPIVCVLLIPSGGDAAIPGCSWWYKISTSGPSSGCCAGDVPVCESYGWGIAAGCAGLCSGGDDCCPAGAIWTTVASMTICTGNCVTGCTVQPTQLASGELIIDCICIPSCGPPD